jgi:glycine/D-amino acid oxidase-like deaminating enzyme
VRVATQVFDQVLPSSTDVVVVGGGIVGASAAFAFAAKGSSTVLCEKGYIGGEQSSRALGWVRVMGRDPRDIPLNVESRRLWQMMHQAVGGETGYRQSGIIYLAERSEELTAFETWLARATGLAVDARIVTAKEAGQLAPQSARTFVGGLYSQGDGRAEPTLAAVAIAEGARQRGAVIAPLCAVRGIDTRAGRVAGVVTEKGFIACQAVLLAGGVWSSRFCGNLDIDLPLLPLNSYALRTAALDGPEICVRGGSLGIRKNLDGGYTIASIRSSADITPDAIRRAFQYFPALKHRWATVGLRLGKGFIDNLSTPRRWSLDAKTPFEKVRILDPGPAPWSDSVWSSATTLFPFLKETSVVEKWGGVIDVTPDSLPIISPARLPGLFIAAGFSGGGFGAGPAAGQLAAELVLGDRPSVDPAPYRYERFFDGSRLVVAD